MTIQYLIAEARALANDHPCISVGHAWESDGGRSCPKGLSDSHEPCSQAVYRCTRCGAYDYGEAGGPAHRECFSECSREAEPEIQYLDCTWAADTQDVCPFCAGESCNICGLNPAIPCDHDSLERHRIP